jgi:hypothetical protein
MFTGYLAGWLVCKLASLQVGGLAGRRVFNVASSATSWAGLASSKVG